MIILPGARFGVGTPVLHWPATLLTQDGWSVLAATWDRPGTGSAADGAARVRQAAAAALDRALVGLPVLVVAKSLGTLALPWAVQNDLPGVWLTPLLGDPALRAARPRRGNRR